MAPQTAPYGSWSSPITAEAVASQSDTAEIEEIILDPITSKVYYAQVRPNENGRSVIVDTFDGQDIFDQSWDARTRVHEYGGGSAIAYDDVFYFSNLPDNRVYKTSKGGSPEAITPKNPVTRFADFTAHPNHPHLVVCTVEDHTNPHPSKVLTYLVVIDALNCTVSKVAEGADFYACARFSPDGTYLAWQQWKFPELPFQSSEIMLATVSISADTRSLQLGQHIHVAGKHRSVAAQEPLWCSANTLFFFSDISGFQNPWKFTFDENAVETGKASPVLVEPISEEFSAPQWWLSRHGSGALSSTKVAATSFRDGRSILYICDLELGSLTEIPTRNAHIQYVQGDGKGKVAFLGQPADSGDVVSELKIDEHGEPVLKTLSTQPIGTSEFPSTLISPGEYRTLRLPPDNRKCYVIYRAPKNHRYDSGFADEKPPVIVWLHGGPNFLQPGNLELWKQFFTSRGWAQIDVNYGGSTGFGRAYRESMNGKWGVIDVQDAWESVRELDALGLVDSKRAVVTGASAGGYSTFQIATTLPNSFAAGSPQYGISDMHKMDEMLHKQEYYLCPRLMGGSWKDCRDVWIARSPIYHVDKIKMPLLVLQGDADSIVPKDQAIDIVDKIKAHGGKAELVIFEGEGHGWRKASTIQTVLEKQLLFFNEVLGFENTFDYDKLLVAPQE